MGQGQITKKRKEKLQTWRTRTEGNQEIPTFNGEPDQKSAISTTSPGNHSEFEVAKHRRTKIPDIGSRGSTTGK